ncbi:MAG TPA: hypothetical protein VKV17_13835 [Bryobacteraceae bacterium]|nr:hypothetical protein [Bryobacteraceae bacterium]
MADSDRQELPGPPNGASGVFQTSTVLIALEGADKIYRSMEEVPGRLRTKLLKSTNSPNAATILIADRRGRQEIARVMRGLGRASSRLAKARGGRAPLQSMLAGETAPAPGWLTQRRKFAILLVLWALAAALIAMLFVRSWGIG